MKAYVTGGTGCVGQNLIRELVLRGWRVTAAHRASSDVARLDGLSAWRVAVDFGSVDSIMGSIPYGTDAVFHVAGNTSHWRRDRETQYFDNVIVTRNIVGACLAKRVERLVFTSTGATLGYQFGDARMAQAIRNSYVRTKRLAELEVYAGMAAGLQAVILHPIIVVGRYDFNSYAQMFKGIHDGSIRFALPGKIVFCHAGAVAKAHVAAATSGRSATRYVLGGPHASWLEFVQAIASAMGKPAPSKVVSKPALRAMAACMEIKAMVDRKKPLLSLDLVSLLGDAPAVQFPEAETARQVLGYDDTMTLQAMVKDCYDWMISERRL